jgi:hypothetical protein
MILRKKILALLGIVIYHTAATQRRQKQEERDPIHSHSLAVNSVSLGLAAANAVNNNKSANANNSYNEPNNLYVKYYPKPDIEISDSSSLLGHRSSKDNFTKYHNNIAPGTGFIIPTLDNRGLNYKTYHNNYISKTLITLYKDVTNYDKGFILYRNKISKKKSKSILKKLHGLMEYIVFTKIDLNVPLDGGIDLPPETCRPFSYDIDTDVFVNNDTDILYQIDNKNILYQMLFILERVIIKSDSFADINELDNDWYRDAIEIFAFICNNYDSKKYKQNDKMSEGMKKAKSSM